MSNLRQPIHVYIMLVVCTQSCVIYRCKSMSYTQHCSCLAARQSCGRTVNVYSQNGCGQFTPICLTKCSSLVKFQPDWHSHIWPTMSRIVALLATWKHANIFDKLSVADKRPSSWQASIVAVPVLAVKRVQHPQSGVAMCCNGRQHCLPLEQRLYAVTRCWTSNC